MLVAGLIVGGIASLLVAAALYLVVLRMLAGEMPAADETHTVKTTDGWTILLHRYRKRDCTGEPVLIVHGAMANHHNWDAPRGATLPELLVRNGYDCWLIDFRGCRSGAPAPGRVKSDATIDDYVLYDLPAALDYIRQVTGYAKVHWVGHSMGGMLLYAYDAIFGAEWIASGTTLGSPIGFEGVSIDQAKPLLALSRLSWPLLEALNRGLAPMMVTFRLHTPLFPINWANTHPGVNWRVLYHMIDVLPTNVAETLCHWGMTKTWRMKNDEVDVLEGLRRLQTPLFAVFGVIDTLVPVSQAQLFFANIANKNKRMLLLSRANGCHDDYSHIDLVLGKNCEREVFQSILQWIREHRIVERMRIEVEDGVEYEVMYHVAQAEAGAATPVEQAEAEPASDRELPPISRKRLAAALTKIDSAFEDLKKTTRKKTAVKKKPTSAKSAAKKKPIVGSRKSRSK